MICCQASLFIEFPNKLLNTSPTGIETDPKLILAKKQSINRTVNIKKESLYVLVVCNYFKGLKKKGS